MPTLRINSLFLTRYKEGKPLQILNDISLIIPRSRITLLLGKSGSGKTSLLRCIAQLEKDYHGDIFYKDESLSTLSAKQRSQVIGFLPQSFSLFPHMNVLDNCAHPLRMHFGKKKKEAYEQVKEILSLLDMEKLASSYQHELSGGQQQRAAIARALTLNPAFLLFDEPTSALDPENADLFINIIEKLIKEGRGVVLSSHDMAFAAKILDRAFFLEQGSFSDVYDSKESKHLSQDNKLHQFLFNTNNNKSTLQNT